MKPTPDYTLYLVTDQDLMSTKTLEEAVWAACQGGVTMVQIREKHSTKEAFLEVARACKRITDAFNVGLIINDDPEIAAEIGAMGVHVGQDDTPVPQVRQIVGPDAIIGVSAHTVEEAVRAREEGADYLGIGGVTRTATKPEAGVLTFDELDAIMEASGLPCVAIGGVNENTIPACKLHPFAGYAVVSAIIAQEDITQAAVKLRRIIDSDEPAQGTDEALLDKARILNLRAKEAELRSKLLQCVSDVKATNPMAPSITNFVTIDFVANAQLAVGGSAAMVYLPDEGEALAAGQGMYLNMGTLMPVYEETVPRTGRALAEAGTPWVLDPVGLGIGSLRTQLVAGLKDCRPAVIRCNASEAIALAQLWGLEEGSDSGIRGVDATDSVASARNAAVALARHTGGAVAVSGQEDLVTDGCNVVRVAGGSPLMPCITGAGCSLGGVCAVYACCGDPLTAALAGTIAYDLAGAKAGEEAAAPASFKVAFLDQLYLASAQDISSYPFILEEA